MKKKKILVILDWVIRMTIYGLILLLISTIFKETIKIDYSMYGIWSILVAMIIYILNKTIRPFIVWITLPLTGITMGIFYPFINVIILNIADLILGSHFSVQGIFMTCLVGILIGFLNMLMDKIIMIIRKEK